MAYNRVTGITTMFDCNTPVYNELGQTITGAQDSATAMKLAGLDWDVATRPVQVCGGKKIPNTFANVREDTGDVLGLVTGRYKVVQNKDAFAFTDNLLGNGVRYETAGVIKDGKRVWMLARMEDHNDYKLAGDECIPYLLFSNNHDGKGSVSVALTLTRVWCQNTLNLALKNAVRTWTMRHSGDVNGKLEEARKTLELTGRYLANMEQTADELTQIAINPSVVEEMGRFLFPIKETAGGRVNGNAEANRTLLMNIYNSKEDVAPHKGSAWGAYLALTDMASHMREGRKTETSAENRFLSLFDGGRDLATVGADWLMQNIH